MTDLAIQLAEAHERIRQLEAILGADDPMPACLDLTSHQARILGVIARRPVSSAEAIATATGADSSANAIATQITYLRRKLVPHGVTIRSRYSEGYYLSDEDRARLRALSSSDHQIAA